MDQGDRINYKNAPFDGTANKTNNFGPKSYRQLPKLSENYIYDNISRPNYQRHNKNDFAGTRKFSRPTEKVRYIRGNTNNYTQGNNKDFRENSINWQKTYNGDRNEIRGNHTKGKTILTPFGVLTYWANGYSSFRYDASNTPHEKP